MSITVQAIQYMLEKHFVSKSEIGAKYVHLHVIFHINYKKIKDNPILSYSFFHYYNNNMKESGSPVFVLSITHVF